MVHVRECLRLKQNKINNYFRKYSPWPLKYVVLLVPLRSVQFRSGRFRDTTHATQQSFTHGCVVFFKPSNLPKTKKGECKITTREGCLQSSKTFQNRTTMGGAPAFSGEGYTVLNCTEWHIRALARSCAKASLLSGYMANGLRPPVTSSIAIAPIE